MQLSGLKTALATRPQAAGSRRSSAARPQRPRSLMVRSVLEINKPISTNGAAKGDAEAVVQDVVAQAKYRVASHESTDDSLYQSGERLWSAMRAGLRTPELAQTPPPPPSPNHRAR